VTHAEIIPEEPLVRLIRNSYDVRVAGPLSMYSEVAGRWIHVRYGFVSDLLSVPFFWRRLVPKSGPGRIAAIFHDQLCVDRPDWCASKMAHKIFEEALIVTPVSKTRRRALYHSVDLFGPKWG